MTHFKDTFTGTASAPFSKPGFFLLALFFIAMLVGAHLWEYHDLHALTHENARAMAKREAEHIRDTCLRLVLLAKEGGEVLDTYIESLNAEGRVAVRMVHSAAINEQYKAEPKESPGNESEEQMLIDGRARDWETDDAFVYVLPFMAQERCQQCHHLPHMPEEPVPLGYVLALLEVTLQKNTLDTANAALYFQTGRDLALTIFIVLFFLQRIYRSTTALHDAEQRTSAIIKTVGEGIVVIGRDAVIRFTNHELRTIFGYAEGELVGKNIELLMPEKYRSLHHAGMERYLAGGKPKVLGTRLELEGLRKSGEAFPIELRIEETATDGGNRFFTAAIRDITERVRAEKDIRMSEQRFREFFNQASDYVIVIDPSPDTGGIIVDANDRACEKHGYRREEFIGLPLTEIDREVTPERVADSVRALMAGEQLTFEAVHTRKDGSTFPVEVSPQIIRVGDDRPYLYSVERDITERKKAERIIRESEEKFRGAFENAAIGMVLADLDGRFLQVNDVFCRMVGYAERELLAMTFREITHPDDLHEDLRNVERLLKGETTFFRIEKRYFHKDGEVVWVTLNVSTLQDIDGRPQYFIAQAQDITERKVAEKALQESELRFRSVAQSATDAIIAADSEGKIISWNNGAKAIFGFDEEEVLGKSLTLLMPEEYREQHEYRRIHYIETGVTKIIGKTVEFQGCRNDGTVFPLEISVATWKTEEDVFFSAIVRDITERRLAEEERKNLIRDLGRSVLDARKEKRKAEEATELKDKFVSLVSHDLKGPLATMLGYLKLVRDDEGEPLNPGAKMIVASAIDSGNNMAALIDDILNVSRLKTGKIVPHKLFHDAYLMATKVMMNFRHIADEKGVSLVNEVPPRTRMYADTTLFYQVLQNLVTNAIKFCNEGDTITVFIPKGHRSAVAVRDTGVGIPKERLENLFDYEVKTTTLGTSGEQGTGLGLPLSRDIMVAHGGDLTVESAVGEGSTVHALLPYVRPQVLLVDDEKPTRELFKMYLDRVDVDLMEAQNGLEALSAVRTSAPHLIITDLNMPEMDGFEFLEKVKSDESLSAIPVIVLTSDDRMETREKAFTSGADDFIAKGVEIHDFIPRIRKFIG